jgi:hypothetical protein
MTISALALAAKKVIDAAWLHGDAYDLSSQAAFALESARLLQSPEMAAELERLRVEVASLQVAVEAPELCADCGHHEDAHSKDGESDCTASGARLLRCSCSFFIPRYGAAELVIEPVAAQEDVTPQVTKLRALLAGQRTAVEDPNGLHHSYRLGRDLPEMGGAR